MLRTKLEVCGKRGNQKHVVLKTQVQMRSLTYVYIPVFTSHMAQSVDPEILCIKEQ